MAHRPQHTTTPTGKTGRRGSAYPGGRRSSTQPDREKAAHSHHPNGGPGTPGGSLGDVLRALLHFPVGVYAAWMMSIDGVSALAFVLVFLAYEAMEDWRIRDRSFKDILGFAWGIAVGYPIFVVWRLL